MDFSIPKQGRLMMRFVQSTVIKTMLTCVILIAIVSSLYLIHTLTLFPKQSQSQKQIDTFMTQVTFQAYNDQGHLSRRIQAQRLEHYPASNSSAFAKPIITLIPLRGAKWHITADHGTSFNHNHELMLEGHVIAHQNAQADQEPTTVKTAQLFYNTQTKMISTPKAITIIRAHSTTIAIGMRFNMQTNQMTLLSHMHTVISPS